MGQRDATVWRDHEVATHLAKVLAGVDGAGATVSKEQLHVRRQRARGQCTQPGGPAEAIRPVGEALLVSQAAKGQVLAATIAANPTQRIE